jgi:tight adherence protein C
MGVTSAAAALAAVLAVAGCCDLVGPQLGGVRRVLGRAPGSAASIPARVAALLGADRISPSASMADRIAAAGEPARMSARDWIALKCCAAVTAALAAGLAAAYMPGRLWIAALAAAPPAGFAAPDFRLAQISRRRSEAALRELPSMLDLLRVTIEAGRAPLPAMGLVGQRFDGPLAAEWRGAATRVALGVSHEAALAQLARRLPADGVRTLVDTLLSASRRGLPLAGALAAQAAAARHARRLHIQERAARAAPKMQLVVAVVMVPSVMLTIGAVLVAELSNTGLGFEY